MSEIKYCEKCGYIKEQCVCEKPITNADRIRNMSYEELAEWISECDMNCDECMDAFGKCIKKNCQKNVLAWLQSEVKESEE